MIRHIQIYLDGSREDEARIAHAEMLGAGRPVHVTGLYVNIMPSYAALPDEAGAAAILAYEAFVRHRGAEIAARLRTRLERVGPTTELRKLEGTVAQIGRRMTSEARNADILVASCPYRGEGTVDDIVEAVLLGAGRSLYLVPPGGCPTRPIRTILVAWLDSRESTRACSEALPLLRFAGRAQVALVTPGHADNADASMAMADFAAQLDRHGVKVDVTTLERDGRTTPETVLEQARHISADLIVAGAYGHSRLLEWLAGGVTRELLAQTPIPILVAH